MTDFDTTAARKEVLNRPAYGQTVDDNLLDACDCIDALRAKLAEMTAWHEGAADAWLLRVIDAALAGDAKAELAALTKGETLPDGTYRPSRLEFLESDREERDYYRQRYMEAQAVVEAARHVVSRDDLWLQRQKSPDGSPISTYCRDSFVELVRVKLAAYDAVVGKDDSRE